VWLFRVAELFGYDFQTILHFADAACPHVVHFLQHQTSRSTTRSTQDTMVNAKKKNLSLLPAGKNAQLMKHSAWWHHQATKGKGGLEAERVRELGALRSLRSKKMLVAEKRWETQVFSNDERENRIEVYLEQETAVATKQVQDAETVMMQDEEHTENVEKGRSTTTKPEITFEGMLNAIGDNLSALTSSWDEQDGEDKDDDEEDTGHGKLSEDDEPGWVMGQISKTVQYRMESFCQKQMMLDELQQLQWGDTAAICCERVIKYRMTELKVPAVGKPQTDWTAATPSPTTFGELMQALDIVPGQSQIP
jgi:hypothetical protein